ncbi:imidazolonepropionase-like domain-containing protein [Kitasatospora sp. LaBMicrA B282]|uniref:imidazolonepropionase-like domain-containing protein n=1 Tax=Kitasatospora sp. LaBMicrA B282 TaxID=3420949 RepID=UPI003D0B69C3
MLTLHRAAVLTPAATAPPDDSVADGAVLVRGDRIAALGPYAELAAAHPEARLREWSGARLTPGEAHPYGALLLEGYYHPDPREGLGVTPRPLPVGGVPAGQYGGLGGSARRGLQLLLRHGAVALAGPFEKPEVRAAVSRSGLRVLAPFEPAQAVPMPGFDGVPQGALTVGERADFAIFQRETGECLGTVLAGRLVYRGR